MASARKPGPIGLNPDYHDLNDGTTILGLSPLPGPVCAEFEPMRKLQGRPISIPQSKVGSGTRSSQPKIPVLRQGSRGEDVEKLQRLLNLRLSPSPALAVDGVFGPLTLKALIDYQRGVSIAADGIVGKDTWYHLLKGDTAKNPQTSSPGLQPSAIKPGAIPGASLARQTSPQAAAVPSGKPASASKSIETPGVWEWTLEQKFTEVLRRTAPKLPGSMRHEFEALLSPASLGMMVGTLVIWVGSHVFGVGEVIDVALLAAGGIFLGMAVFDVASEFGEFLGLTTTASDVNELDEAASHLARAISILGIAAFIALLAKIVHGRGAKGAAAEAPPEVTPAKPSPKVTKTEVQTPRPPPQKRPGLHNEEWDSVKVEDFKTRRKVDIEGSPKDNAAARMLEEQGRSEKQIHEILSSGDDFRPKKLNEGDKLYGFDSIKNPNGKKNKSSPYWMDETGYRDVKSKYCKDGVWDKEGVKNYLALPCYNRAEVIDTATVTKSHVALESSIGKATEQIGYIKGDGSTGMMGKIMSGGGAQITPDTSSLSAVTRLSGTP